MKRHPRSAVNERTGIGFLRSCPTQLPERVPEVTVKTTGALVALARPKLYGREAFASRLFGIHVTKTNALETLVIASFVRGRLVRDVEAR
jgi:hypothetical protein